MTLEIDSEQMLKTCEGYGDTEKFECNTYCVPIRTTYGPFGIEGQEQIQEIR